MKHSLVGVLLGAGILLTMGARANAQEATILPGPSTPAVDLGAASLVACDAPVTPRIWFGGDYLGLWIKNAPLPIPLVTTNNVNGQVGALGESGTTILYGSGSQNMGTFSGMRLFTGTWLNQEQSLGVEAGGFWLPRRTAGFSAFSDGKVTLATPFYNAGYSYNKPAFSEDAGLASITFGNVLFAGGIIVNNTTELWGTEANVVWNLRRDERRDLNLLVGYRYINLDESLTNQIVADGRNGASPRPLFVASDSFQTSNQFNGGQIGMRQALRRGNLTATSIVKVALGTNHQIVNIDGQGTQTPATGQNLLKGTTAQFRGGVFALPSNIGRQTHDEFAVVPEVQLNLSYNHREWLCLSVGYNFLYWNNVVRPGNQMDHSVNFSQGLGGTLVGAASPAPLFNTTDFFAHGLNFGVEFRY